MKQYSFFFHYNKPQSQKHGKPIITIHYRGQCIMVHNIQVDVPTWGKINKDQPRFVVAGKAQNIEIIDNVGYIK